VEAAVLGFQMAAPAEGPEAAVEVRPRRVLPRRERPERPVVAQSVLGLLRGTHPVAGEPKAAIGPSWVIMPSTVEREVAGAVRDHLPVSTVAHLYMAAGPERAAVVLLGPEELVVPGGLILRAAAGLLGLRTGTPAGLAAVTHSVAATVAVVAVAARRIRTAAPEGPVERLPVAEAAELRVVLVQARVV
jgi:hypothetical protein